MEFALRLKKLREKHDISQAALAKAIDIGASTVAMWETGERFPTAQYLDKVATFFDVTTDYLLGRTDNPHGVVLDVVYFRLASEAQEVGLPPADIQTIIDLYKKYKKN